MTDLALILPTAPDGVDDATHLRSLLSITIERAPRLIDGVHKLAHDDLRDLAADASTHLRETRQACSLAIEHDLDDVSMLTNLYAMSQRVQENADDLLMRAELRDALRGDSSMVRECDAHALCIGELAGEGFVSFMVNQVRDPELYAQVQDGAQVPLLHTLIRAIAEGFVAGRARPLDSRDSAHRIDNLLLKCMKANGMARPDDLLANLRMASITRIALWNFTRISLRDDHGEGYRAQYERRRREALQPIKADARFHLEELGVQPDFEHAYDIGVGLAMVEPIIAQRAELHDVIMPRRANPAAWISLFDPVP